jgi:hypothetical protein
MAELVAVRRRAEHEDRHEVSEPGFEVGIGVHVDLDHRDAVALRDRMHGVETRREVAAGRERSAVDAF